MKRDSKQGKFYRIQGIGESLIAVPFICCIAQGVQVPRLLRPRFPQLTVKDRSALSLHSIQPFTFPSDPSPDGLGDRSILTAVPVDPWRVWGGGTAFS